MEMEPVPAALQERLGFEASAGLLQLLDTAHRDGRADVIAACTDRFERRLVEEIAGVRLQIAQVETSIRQDMMAMGADIRRDMNAMGADIRRDMNEMGAAIRRDMAELGTNLRREMSAMGADNRAETASIRQEMASGRVELLKWCFLFWIGPVVAVAGIMGMMLRMFRP